jgi:DNA-binding NarL/FixJ family response regulator
MRVVIADASLRDGRKLAAQIEELVPTADVLLYSDAESAVAGVSAHAPDVVMAAPTLGDSDGPSFLGRVLALDGPRPKLVGVVDQPDADLSVRYVDAGAVVVLARPVGSLDLRTALRHTAGGVPGG